MNQMYTVMDCNPFRDTPYRTHLGTLSRIGIQSQGKFKALEAGGLTAQACVLVFENRPGGVVAGGAHHAASGVGAGTT
jgi:hypothetical protein